MITILIVEDNPDKYRAICYEILKVQGINQENIYHSNDIVSAKRSLKERKFSLLILDLHLPRRMGQSEEKMSGLDILDFISVNNKAISPDYILGLTAYEDAFSKSQSDYSSIIWQVIKFEFSSQSWRESLNVSIKYLVANDKPPYRNDGKSYHLDAGIVCALDEELHALLDLVSKYERIEINYDQNNYYKFSIPVEDRFISVVAVACPNMGMSTSAVVTHQLITKFRPRIVTMAGICAGIKGKSNIGDVLVADPCFEWGGGKLIEDCNGDLQLKTASYPWRIDSTVKSVLRNIKDDSNYLSNIATTYPAKKIATPVQLIIAPMASGSSVLQSQKMMDFIKEQHKDLVGVEMESYAVFTACELTDEPKPYCVSIKSVCDFGDHTKEDGHHNYAAYTSSKITLEFLQKWFDRNG
ncbi:hypothetical protein BH581_02005 [Vibrio splendidus]|uniref:phosphorylase family protein n=1 Tax=Vibrio splendidus TaxID=29497 RepID=UPI000975DB1C|nr:hypothetical protein [Vibrio splendidus]OMO27662.1 hypothetical protein BH581_02005 [Vibrio splendidus]